jgi:hypothetical protein
MYLSEEAELSKPAFVSSTIEVTISLEDREDMGLINTEQCKVNKVKHIPPSQDLSIKASRRCSGLIVT